VDPFSYAMALLAQQSMQRQFDESEPHRRSVSKARATRRRGKVRGLANLVVDRRTVAPSYGAHLRAKAEGRKQGIHDRIDR
jgi:hypothetical protein